MRAYTLIALACCLQSALCATYYVDFDSGNNAANGTSSSTPWKHCPGDDNATGMADGTSLQPADTVIFKGGVSYIGKIGIGASGSLGSVITYDGNSAGTWGTGRAIIDGDATYYHAFENSTGVAYIHIKSFEITNTKNNLGYVDAVVERDGEEISVTYTGSNDIGDLGAIRAHLGCDNWTISDCIFHRFENWSDLSVPGAESDEDEDTIHDVPCQQQVIYWYGATNDKNTNLVVEDCEFYGIGTASIYLVRASDVIIRRCNFGGSEAGDAKGWFSVAVRITTCDNTSFYDNVLHDGWQYEGEHVDGQRSHAGDWIHIYGGQDNTLIERNLFYNDVVFTYNMGTTSFVYPSDAATNLRVRNNVVINPHASRVLYIGTGGVDYLWFENNTMLTFSSAAGSYYAVSIASDVGENIVIRNNIFAMLDNSALAIRDLRASWTGTIDNNVYYVPSNAKPFSTDSVAKTFAEWQTLTSDDGDSVVADPLFVTQPASGLTSSSANLRLTAESSAIGAGADLSASFSDDFTGATRSAWDIGAYEYANTTSRITAQTIRAGTVRGP